MNSKLKQLAIKAKKELGDKQAKVWDIFLSIYLMFSMISIVYGCTCAYGYTGIHPGNVKFLFFVLCVHSCKYMCLITYEWSFLSF